MAEGGTMVLLGIPAAAWDYMKDGKTHLFDLTKLGLPIQLVLFGAESHDAAMKVIEARNSRLGIAALDERRADFSINPKGAA